LELRDLFSLGATCSKFYLQFMDNFQYFKNLHEKATAAENEARAASPNFDKDENDDPTSIPAKRDTNVVEDFLTQALAECLQNCDELPPKLRSDLEHCFDPQSARMSAVVSARTFKLPVHFYHFLWKNIEAQEPFTRIVQQAFANQSIALHKPKPKAASLNPSEGLPWLDGDAWTSWRSPMIKFGNLLQPIQTPEQLCEIIEADIDKANVLMKSQKYSKGGTIQYPSVLPVIELLGEAVGATKVMIWHDQQFKSVSFSGSRLLVFGKTTGCLIQWETYTNFCGGPYSSYSCGMG